MEMNCAMTLHSGKYEVFKMATHQSRIQIYVDFTIRGEMEFPVMLLIEMMYWPHCVYVLDFTFRGEMEFPVMLLIEMSYWHNNRKRVWVEMEIP